MLVCWVCTYEGVIVFDFQQYFFFKSQKIRNKKEKKEDSLIKGRAPRETIDGNIDTGHQDFFITHFLLVPLNCFLARTNKRGGVEVK